MMKGMDIFALSKNTSPSTDNLVSTFPTVTTTKKNMDKLFTWKISEYCKAS